MTKRIENARRRILEILATDTGSEPKNASAFSSVQRGHLYRMESEKLIQYSPSGIGGWVITNLGREKLRELQA